jgi:hypothetical protein
MDRIRTILVMLALVFLAAQTALSQVKNDPTASEYFKSLRSKVTANLPSQFTGELSGKTINAKIGNIPQDSLLDKKQRAYVQLAYSKKKGIGITVRNVDELYQDLYRDLPKQIFAFDLILSSDNNESFLKKYDFSWQSQSPGLNVLRLGIRSAENALLIYVRPDVLQIQRIDYALGQQLLSSTIVTYSEITNKGKKYLIPTRFITKAMDADGRNRPEVIDIGAIYIK